MVNSMPFLRYELQERGLLDKEEVKVIPDIYARYFSRMVKLLTS